MVKKNAEFWVAKIERNRARDQKAVDHLKSIGWTVLRFWEHESPEDVVEAIISARSYACEATAKTPAPLQALQQNRPGSPQTQPAALCMPFELTVA